jgi:hypothetical protein
MKSLGSQQDLAGHSLDVAGSAIGIIHEFLYGEIGQPCFFD